MRLRGPGLDKDLLDTCSPNPGQSYDRRFDDVTTIVKSQTLLLRSDDASKRGLVASFVGESGR